MKKREPVNTFVIPEAYNDPNLGGVYQNALDYQAKYDQAYGQGAPRRYKFFGMGDAYNQAVQQAWQKRLEKIVSSQKDLDAIAQPRYESGYVDNVIGTEIEGKRINPNTPRLAQNGVYGSDFLKNVLAGSTNPTAIGMMDNVYNTQQQRSYGLPNLTNFTPPPANTTANKPGEPLLDTETPTITTGIQQAYNSLKPNVNPTELPTFLSGDALGNIQQAITAGGNSGIAQGQARYEFDQEAPKRAAEIQKDLQQVQKLILEGKETEAKTKLLQIEARYKGPLLQSKINQNNRPPAGRAPTLLELMTPEQREAYVNKEAGLARPGLSTEDEWKFKTAAQGKDWWGNPTPAALTAQEMLDSFKNPSPKPTSSVPRGKAATPKGRPVVLSTGKKVNL